VLDPDAFIIIVLLPSERLPETWRGVVVHLFLRVVDGGWPTHQCWFTNRPNCEHTFEQSYPGIYSIFQ